jgi:mycofactocin precursor
MIDTTALPDRAQCGRRRAMPCGRRLRASVVSRSMDDTALATEIDDTTQTTDDLLDEELLVEEISIDGMCGVY